MLTISINSTIFAYLYFYQIDDIKVLGYKVDFLKYPVKRKIYKVRTLQSIKFN